ncbi:MaoC family dehydratase N-terminal domain-containing protein [uncultured Tateyamaria sp.]|uniref:FAS1-like dehydratase domain-containing protein n=1 Tax=uncultured Tateyamaria sp. TaxID=455651 RepID=UPI00261BE95A|nr:MaoC family dehydratase N-terminal domain-containing protein [uncultured Tateyamaria sp.]
MDQVNLDAWVGKTVSDVGGVGAATAIKVHATIGRSGDPAPRAGDLLPPLWHWSAFAPTAHTDLLGADGHPAPGTLLPPMGLPRRMWAGGALGFHAPVRVGDTLHRHTSVRSVETKTTRTGRPMALVTLDHMIFGPQGLAIEERQDIVYLPMPERFVPPHPRAMPADTAESMEMTPTLLFRYSAVTFNAHRIHYDLDYAQSVEKYPGLVVHGPLQAALLMRHATEQAGSQPVYFDFRAVHPVFAGTPLDICATEEDGTVVLFTGQNGHQGMQATAVFEATQ